MTVKSQCECRCHHSAAESCARCVRIHTKRRKSQFEIENELDRENANLGAYTLSPRLQQIGLQ